MLVMIHALFMPLFSDDFHKINGQPQTPKFWVIILDFNELSNTVPETQGSIPRNCCVH